MCIFLSNFQNIICINLNLKRMRPLSVSKTMMLRIEEEKEMETIYVHPKRLDSRFSNRTVHEV
jgi:hypothetical protein